MFYWISRIIFIAKKGKIKDDPIAFAITDIISYLCLFMIINDFLGLSMIIIDYQGLSRIIQDYQ